MKKKRKGIVQILAFLLITVTVLMSSQKVNAASKSYITIGEYVKLLVQELDVKVEKKTLSGYLDAATSKGILLKKNEFKDYSKKLTREQCALLTQRACEIRKATDYNQEICDKVRDLNRISDYKKIGEKYKEAVVKVFSNGVIIGSSDGKYTHTRTFSPKAKVSVNGAKIVVSRIKNKKKRYPMSPDGQLIRTTNLPVNAEEYDYILASFPNSYYEMMFAFEGGKSTGNLLELGLAYKPVDIKNKPYARLGYKGTIAEEEYKRSFSQNWADIVQENMELLFNVDYRTIDDNWVKKVANTYYAQNEEDYQELLHHIRLYVDLMKKNHVVCETSKVALDLSSMYYYTGYKIRVYVRYRMKADDMSPEGVIIYDRGGFSTFTETKKWVWKECCFDISVGASNGSRGDDYKVDNIYLTDCDYILKTKVLKCVFNEQIQRYEFK